MQFNIKFKDSGAQRLYNYLVIIIYLSFALDSLLKINLGFKIHLGILLILILNSFYFFIIGYRKSVKFHKLDFWLILFTIYTLINGLLLTGLNSLFIFFYFFLALNVYFFINLNFNILTRKVFYYFQILMIVSGLFQFFLFLLFDYQINFLDVAHYTKGSSVTLRLRGFFVEPNWFAIAFTFNTFLLIRNDIVSFIKKHTVIFLLTIIVFLLNGTIGPLAVLLFTYSYKYFTKNIVIGALLLIIAIGGGYFIMQKRAEIKKNKSGIELFNYYSRTEPFSRVNEYFSHQPGTHRLFGEGLGSWGTLGIRNNLSVLTYEESVYDRDSSELHVFLFELGLIGTFIFFLDIFNLFKNNFKFNFYIRGAILLFIVSFLLYPIFKFMMYMVYYFVLRTLIKNNKKELYLKE